MVMYPLFSRDQEDRHLREDELVVLVEKRYPRPHDAAVRAGRRGLFLNDFQHQAQRVARIDRLGPAKLINADAEDAGGLHHAALHGQLHGDRGGVPAARHQPLEGAARGGCFVEVEWLRIVARCELLDLLERDGVTAGIHSVADAEIVEVFFHAIAVRRNWNERGSACTSRAPARSGTRPAGPPAQPPARAPRTPRRCRRWPAHLRRNSAERWRATSS